MADNIQNPKSLYFNGDSSDTLDLNNFVDQLFNVSPVSQISVPLVTKTDEDIKFDGKLSTNFDNLTTAGYESLMSLVSPSDTVVNIDLTSLQQGVYVAEETGYICFQIESSNINDYIMIKNSSNGMVVKDTYFNNNTIIIDNAKYDLGITEGGVKYLSINGVNYYYIENLAEGITVYADMTYQNSVGTITYLNTQNEKVTITLMLPLSVTLPVAKYQTVVFSYNSTIDSVKSAFLVPYGNSYNLGEALSDTRDYKALMANIGFPDITGVMSLGLPLNNSQDITDSDGYYSICAILAEGDYITLSTDYYGATIKYDGTNTKQYLFLPVKAQTIVTFDYRLTNNIEYIVFIPPVGVVHTNG